MNSGGKKQTALLTTVVDYGGIISIKLIALYSNKPAVSISLKYKNAAKLREFTPYSVLYLREPLQCTPEYSTGAQPLQQL